MKTGLDRLLADPQLLAQLKGRRVALVAHPASVTSDLTHSLDALIAAGVKVSSAFGPQHGLKGDKQDNMVETANAIDPRYGIPIFSLYGEVRRPTGQMMSSADVFLFDLQDLGCRIYTFVTTLLYLLEEAAQASKVGPGKEVWVLDRPNPAGRPVEGTLLVPGQESFVGAAPMPMRHGLTMGEMGHWFVEHFGIDVEYKVVAMEGWRPGADDGFGWPTARLWINPSPNAANVNMARCYAGTVMLEGTTLSEGRGTTRPLEVLFGAPDICVSDVNSAMRRIAPDWLDGCGLRECWFEPTFHKHAGKLCNALMIHAEGAFYNHQTFRPWRLQALAFKAIRQLYPDYPLWRDFPYEYELTRLAIDVINGGPGLREWVDDAAATPHDLDAMASHDEAAWIAAVRGHLLY